MNPAIVADLERGGIHKREATALTESRAQVRAQGKSGLRHQLDKTVVRDQLREGPKHVLDDVLLVIILEIAVTRSMKERDDGHHFR